MTNFSSRVWLYQPNFDILYAFSTEIVIPDAYVICVIFTKKLHRRFYVRLDSKYICAYIYIKFSLIEIKCLLNMFTVKYLFSYKRRMK